MKQTTLTGPLSQKISCRRPILRLTLLLCLFTAGSIHAQDHPSFQFIEPASGPNPGVHYGGILAAADNVMYLWYLTDNNGFEAAIFDGTSLRLIPNPDHSTEKLYGVFGSPAIFHDKLYFRYRTANNQYQLAVLDNDRIRLFPNPPNADYYSKAPAVVLKDNLIMQFRTINPKERVLARFDGNAVNLIPWSAEGEYNGSPLVFQGRLYFSFLLNGNSYLGYTGGRATDFVRGTDQNYNNQGPSFEFKGKLFVGVSPGRGFTTWGAFDGQTVTRLTVPLEPGVAGCPCTVAGDVVYFRYNGVKGHFMATTDGATMTVIPNLPQGGEVGYGRNELGSTHDNLLWKGKVYFPYSFPAANSDAPRLDQLAQYDGKQTTLVPNTSNAEVLGDLFIYDDNLFYNLDHHLARYDGREVKVMDIRSPGYYLGQPFEFKGALYINYQGRLARYQPGTR